MKTTMPRAASLIALHMLLAGCAVKTITADGPYLQLGPADALLAEFELKDTDYCRQSLVQFSTFTNTSKCAASSARLAYVLVARNDFWEMSIPVSARTAKACEDWQKRLGKAQGWRIVESCKPRTAPPA